MDKQRIGIKENLGIFMLLVVINFFVGSMVGMERTILPLLGEEKFGLATTSASLSFIISFGFSKAIVNYFAGKIADHYGRKQVLVIGWVFGLFVPILILGASHWSTVIIANLFLGINQGLAWSMTVNMKIDLSKTAQRGTAVGINEFAGYAGVAIMAAVSGYIATSISLYPFPFYFGLGLAVVGLILSMFVRDTTDFIKKDQTTTLDKTLSSKEVFKLTTWKNKQLASISVAGMATNFKDGMAWGLFPIYFSTVGLTVGQVGAIIAVYPAAWGFFQLFTGIWSDRVGRKRLITGGMWLQAIALFLILTVNTFWLWFMGAVLLGVGTAMVYPTLQAAIGDIVAPAWRASSMGVYRMWRDSGYAFGALAAGVIADLLGVSWAIGLVAMIPFFAGLLAQIRLKESLEF
ncbi:MULTISPECIES: MFS transporter [unclassified Virgibacillus]|uniref:MFS transporter n=1 Tax=unclassified Virgibacillus TaxID=2620237 RepID=UPI0024DE5F26|nr:MFS transporter [Virgibacillus sp. LDC-1]